eukprot:g62070.t1
MWCVLRTQRWRWGLIGVIPEHASNSNIRNFSALTIGEFSSQEARAIWKERQKQKESKQTKVVDVSDSELRHIARLACLELPTEEKELQEVKRQLQSTINWLACVRYTQTEVKPLRNPGTDGIQSSNLDSLRPDRVSEPTEGRAASLLSLSQSKDEGYFSVPKSIGVG